MCPIYERTGGHAYNSVYPGPIGAILTPQLLGVEQAPSLPYASSLCGACYDVCPVKINIPDVLVHLRAKVVQHRQAKNGVIGLVEPESLAMKTLTQVFSHPTLYEQAQKLARVGQWPLTRKGHIQWLPPPLGVWTTMRDLPAVPPQSFR